METNIKIHSNKLLSLFSLLCGIAIIVLAVMVADRRGEMPMGQLVLGGVVILIGILQLTTPTVVVTDTEIQMRNLLGMTLRRIPYQASNTEVKEGKVYVNDKKVRIGVGGFMHAPDVKKAVEYFSALKTVDSATVSKS